MTESFPRQQARTRRFSLGEPRSFQVAPDGRMVAFLRSKGGSDPVTCLWALDLPPDPARGAGPRGAGHSAGPERLVVDPAAIGAGADEPAEERARRERSREQAGGVVAFATDAGFTMAAFAIAGDVYTTVLRPDGEGPRRLNTRTPAIDPRPDPAGGKVAYVCHGGLRITDLTTGADDELIGPSEQDGPNAAEVTYGLAEFVAAEEMGRLRGFWWAPDGSALLVARVDNSPVQRWHIADPANPGQPPTEIAYPAAGTPNARVDLLIVGLDGTKIPVRWDDGGFEYFATATWDSHAPLIVAQTRDQRRMRLLQVDPGTGDTTVLRDDTDADWLDIVPGVPATLADGRVAWTVDADGARRLLLATPAELADRSASPVTPPSLKLRGVLSVDGDTVLLAASGDDPTQIALWRLGPAGLTKVSPDDGVHGGVHGGVRSGGTTVLASRSMAGPGQTVTVLRDDADTAQAPASQVAAIGSLAERPALPPLRIQFLQAGPKQIRTAVLLPSWYEPGSGRLPVLMDPYGGPHAQRVLAAADAYLTSQWFADQGFAVVIADGRGTPGRGPEWDRAVARDLAEPVLQDQVEALTAAAQDCQDLDLSKVAIRGWSFGGYLSALAVMRRPDVFHAAIAGAPVTDWRLYDTHYTERYLGHPDQDPAAYERSSLFGDAAKLSRPLMIIHGLADDNVVVAHSLRLSSALLAAGRPHQVLPLSGVTHMASQEQVAENLLLLQVDFLRDALGLAPV